jgi:hypothetical protein
MAVCYWNEEYRNWLFYDGPVRAVLSEDLTRGYVWTARNSHLPTFDEVAQSAAIVLGDETNSQRIKETRRKPHRDIPTTHNATGVDGLGISYIQFCNPKANCYWRGSIQKFVCIDGHKETHFAPDSVHVLEAIVGPNVLDWLKAQPQQRDVPEIINPFPVNPEEDDDTAE